MQNLVPLLIVIYCCAGSGYYSKPDEDSAVIFADKMSDAQDSDREIV